MRRLSDVPWTSQRLPSSPSCRRWHTCGRRRAPRCKNIKFILNKLELCLPHSKCLCGHVSALCLAVGRDDPECAKQKNQQVLQHDVDGCDNMGIRKRPANRRAASQRARWQPETNNQISAIFFLLTCLHPLHRISDVDGVKEGRLILGTKDPSRDLARRFCTKSIFCTNSYVFAQFIIQYDLFCMENS